jgi:hypothetical protein
VIATRLALADISVLIGLEVARLDTEKLACYPAASSSAWPSPAPILASPRRERTRAFLSKVL